MRSPQQMIEELKHYVAVLGGEIEDSAVLLGQSAGVINSVESIEDIISTIVKDAETHLKNATSNIK